MIDKKLDRIRILDSFSLKMIAICTMVIDHTGAILFPQYLVFRYIGRIAFPVFCFLLVEGFFHTRNIKKYILRMIAFAIISEIPYDLAFRNTILEFGHQNVFITLLLGLLMLYAYEHTKVEIEKLAIACLFFFISSFLSCDYGYKGLLLISIFYFFRKNRPIACFAACFWNLLWSVWKIQIFGAFSAIPILLYNGKPGKKIKYFFYFFYPAHLIILYFIGRFLL